MPAKPLTPEELADAARLKILFQAWQKSRKDKGEPASQEAAIEILQFGQSAVSQYLNGGIPLNVDAAYRFAEMLGRPIASFSPTLAERAARYSAAAFAPIISHPTMPDLACETSEEIGLLTTYRLAKKVNDLTILNAYDAISEEFLGRLAAERKKV
jgi:transcriptional regulator with XRE-family HTH domain